MLQVCSKCWFFLGCHVVRHILRKWWHCYCVYCLVRKSFYVYCFLLAVLNSFQTIGCAMLYFDHIPAGWWYVDHFVHCTYYAGHVPSIKCNASVWCVLVTIHWSVKFDPLLIRKSSQLEVFNQYHHVCLNVRFTVESCSLSVWILCLFWKRTCSDSIGYIPFLLPTEALKKPHGFFIYQ